MIAEDLGVITPDVVALRDELGFPGMVVMQFAFDGRPGQPAPAREPPRAERRLHRHARHRHRASAGSRPTTGPLLDAAEPHWSLIELAYSSPARLAIVPAQDVLGLGSEARMNVPGQESGNWRWRLEPGQLTPEHAARLRGGAERHGRLP